MRRYIVQHAIHPLPNNGGYIIVPRQLVKGKIIDHPAKRIGPSGKAQRIGA